MDFSDARAAYFARKYLQTERDLKSLQCGLERREDFRLIIVVCTVLLEAEDMIAEMERAALDEQQA